MVVNLTDLSRLVRNIIKNEDDSIGIISIDSDGVYLRDARVHGVDYQERVVKVNNRKLNSRQKPTITMEYWFFIDGVRFYSYNDIEFKTTFVQTQTTSPSQYEFTKGAK